MSYIYVIHSSKYEKFYVGITDDVELRIKSHNSGKVKSSKAYIPWRLVHREEYRDKQEARVREKFLKSAAGRRWRKNNINLGD